jgi:hypothetical protein
MLSRLTQKYRGQASNGHNALKSFKYALCDKHFIPTLGFPLLKFCALLEAPKMPTASSIVAASHFKAFVVPNQEVSKLQGFMGKHITVKLIA